MQKNAVGGVCVNVDKQMNAWEQMLSKESEILDCATKLNSAIHELERVLMGPHPEDPCGNPKAMDNPAFVEKMTAYQSGTRAVLDECQSMIHRLIG
jgi:hypothetical protein